MPDDTSIPSVRIPDVPSPLDVRPPLPSTPDRPGAAAAPQDPMSRAVREELVRATHQRWQAIGAAQQRKLERINALQQVLAGAQADVPPQGDPQ